MADVKPWRTKGYDPEWLALEDATGGRFFMGSDLSIAVPQFNQTFTQIAQLWPPSEKHLHITNEAIQDGPYEMAIRVYRPESATPLPLIVLFHGGAFVAGNLDTDEPLCKSFAAKVPCVVMSVEYPLAPASSIDQMIEAGVESVEWARLNASRISADPDRIILAGGSAGAMMVGFLAYHYTVLPYLPRPPEKSGTSPQSTEALHRILPHSQPSSLDPAHSNRPDTSWFAGLAMMYPTIVPLELPYSGPYAELMTSPKELGEDCPVTALKTLTDISPRWMIRTDDPRHYIGLSPLGSLDHWPKTYCMAGGKDALRDNAVVLGERLNSAEEGALEGEQRCRVDMYEGLPHWFHAFPQLKRAHEGVARTVEGVRWLLGE